MSTRHTGHVPVRYIKEFLSFFIMTKLNLYEIIGIMIGDGCVLYYPEKAVYGIEISGNVDEEKEYFEMISSSLEKMFDKKPRISIKYSSKGRCLKLVLWGKSIAEYFIKLGITPRKTYTARIPTSFLSWNKSKHIVRGLFETDGSLYFSYSKANGLYPTYPRLEIKTVSLELANQLYFLLKNQSFNVQLRKTESTYCVYVSGVKMLNKWVKEIGFTNERSKTKYLFWKKYGYYIPKMSQQRRKILLLN